MTSIHARIPASLRQAVDAARRRGDDTQFAASAAKQAHPAEPRSMSRLGATLLQKRLAPQHSRPSPLPLSRNSVSSDNEELSEDEEEDHDPSKENDPSQSPSLVVQSPRSPRKNVLGKRPLSELPTPTDPDEGMTASEKNIPINQSSHNDTILPSTSMKKSRLAARGGDVHVYNRLSETRDGCSSTKNGLADTDDEKENGERSVGKHLPDQVKIPVRPATVRPTLRKVSNVVSSKAKSQPRVGIRRL